MKNFVSPYLGFLFVFILFACGSDDSDDYVALPIQTNADTAQVRQNESVEIDILSNDTNIPTIGTLTTSNATNGSIEILNNNTPDNPADDKVVYTPNQDFVGTDTFEYTICDNNFNCATETVTIEVMPVSPVNFNINAVPYMTLSEYNFYDGQMADLAPVYGVLPYELITPLFTDYAIKKRFIWMPEGQKATYEGDHDIFDFPTSTVLIKNFYYENVLPGNTTKIIETRLLIKKDSEWIFANYIWNEAQTEATLDVAGNGGFVEVEWLQNNQPKSVNYRIPATSECLMCHKTTGIAIPLGPKPQNINSIFNYDGGESKNQLAQWESMGYLDSNYPSSINTVVKWDDASQPLELRVRSYFDVNCAHCHTTGGHCDYRPIKLAFNESADPVNLGICVEPDEDISLWIDEENPSHIVSPNDISNSALFYRMNTTEGAIRMPMVGRTLIHDEVIPLLENWINSITINCD